MFPLAGSRRGRGFTVSIALPGSIVDNAQTLELKTYLAGQVTAYSVYQCIASHPDMCFFLCDF